MSGIEYFNTGVDFTLRETPKGTRSILVRVNFLDTERIFIVENTVLNLTLKQAKDIVDWANSFGLIERYSPNYGEERPAVVHAIKALRQWYHQAEAAPVDPDPKIYTAHVIRSGHHDQYIGVVGYSFQGNNVVLDFEDGSVQVLAGHSFSDITIVEGRD